MCRKGEHMNWSKARFMGYGVLLGTAGIKILSSQDAKKVYTNLTAAALRGKDEALKQYTRVKENCEDIANNAKAINEKRKKEDLARKIEEAEAFLATVKTKK